MRDEKFPSEVRILPVRLLLARPRALNFKREPSSSRILPSSLLSTTLSSLSSEQCEIGRDLSLKGIVAKIKNSQAE